VMASHWRAGECLVWLRVRGQTLAGRQVTSVPASPLHSSKSLSFQHVSGGPAIQWRGSKSVAGQHVSGRL